MRAEDLPTHARAAAQEWINRTAVWVRAEAPELDAGFTLFEIRRGQPHWWVAADISAKGSIINNLSIFLEIKHILS